MAEHTPGPWQVYDGPKMPLTLYDGPFGIVIAELQQREVTETDRANFALMAALPKLLAACEALVNAHPAEDPDGYGLTWYCLLCDGWVNRESDIPHTIDCPVVMARKAIAEAKGETDA